MFSARFLRGITKIQRPEEASRFLRLDRYWCTEVAEPLIERVDHLVALKPRQALALAEIAAELVRRMRTPARELQAHAFCALAATQRATGKLADSESSFQQAEELAIEVVEVRELLRKIQERIRGIRSTSIRYVIWYTEGLLYLLMVEYRLAINHFLQARSGFLRIEQIADYARVSIDLVDALVRKDDKEKARIILQRTAEEIAEFPDYQDFAKVFQLAQEQPLEEAAQFARARILSLPLPEQSSGSRLITICIDMTVKPIAQ